MRKAKECSKKIIIININGMIQYNRISTTHKKIPFFHFLKHLNTLWQTTLLLLFFVLSFYSCFCDGVLHVCVFLKGNLLVAFMYETTEKKYKSDVKRAEIKEAYRKKMYFSLTLLALILFFFILVLYIFFLFIR